MKTIAPKKEFKNIIDGGVLKENDEILTYGMVFMRSLLAAGKDLPGDEQVKRYKLALKMNEEDDKVVEISAEEVVLLKKVVAESYGPLVTGQVWEELDK